MSMPSPPPPCVDEHIWPGDYYQDRRKIRSSEILGSYPSAKAVLINKLKKEYAADFKLGRLRCGRVAARSSISFVRSAVHHPVPALVAAPRAATVARTLQQRFQEEAEKWDRETTYLSSTPKMILHESYQKIIAMGPNVVPHLLRDLQQNRRSWFWALRHLTDANPVPPEDQGNLDKMIAAWLAWGRREGRI